MCPLPKNANQTSHQIQKLMIWTWEVSGVSTCIMIRGCCFLNATRIQMRAM
ncbi:unnamed protein product [Rhodiola kirilowii]